MYVIYRWFKLGMVVIREWLIKFTSLRYATSDVAMAT